MKTKLISKWEILSSLFWLLGAISLLNVEAQYLNYTNFTTKDGLVSNKVYSILEDKNGFVWISTDQGVSRYDGVTFTNFSAKDGLPDNEIIGLYEDKSGRIWFHGFSKEPSYYLNGKVFNADNDPFLNRIKKYKPVGICMVILVKENQSLGFIIQQNGKRYIIGKDISDIQLKQPEPITENPFQQFLFKTGNQYHQFSLATWFSWTEGDSMKRQNVSDLQKNHPQTLMNMHYCRITSDRIFGLADNGRHIWSINPLKRQLNLIMKTSKSYKSMDNMDDCNILIGDSNYVIYDKDFTTMIESAIFPFKIERVFQDRMKNKWIGTFDNGLYLVRSQAPKKLNIIASKERGINTIEPYGNLLLLATEKNGLLGIDKLGHLHRMLGNTSPDRILGMVTIEGYHYIGTGSKGLLRSNLDFSNPVKIFDISVKDIEKGMKNELLVGTRNGIYIYKSNKKDSGTWIHTGRTTAVYRITDNKIWFGGVNGISELTEKNGIYSFQRKKLDSKIDESYIIEIRKDDNDNIWIATGQNGLFCYTRQKQLLRFNTSAPLGFRLLSDICQNLTIDSSNRVWLSSGNGLSLITPKNKENTKFTLQNYTLSESIPGKTINDVCFWDNRIMMATPEGVFEFTSLAKPLNKTSIVLITGLLVNNKVKDHTSEIRLAYDQNNLVIKYAASFINSGNSYRFKYRVIGLSSDWIETNNLEVPLLGLESGNYIFEIKALNAQGYSGQPTSIAFAILKPWFKQWWFISILILLSVFTIYYYYKLSRDRILLGKKSALLRLRMLRSQMNPHFVFNAMNNIQRLVQIKSLDKANAYIGTLASVMRKSLDYSDLEFVKLEEEISYTKQYVEIEQLRFGDKFNFEFKCNLSSSELSTIKVPPLLLQPLIENAIKHAFKGVDYKGIIRVEVKTKDETLNYEVSDNGKGFDTSQVQQWNYGLGIINERIELLYKAKKQKSSFSIESNPNSQTGTIVFIELPILN